MYTNKWEKVVREFKHKNYQMSWSEIIHFSRAVRCIMDILIIICIYQNESSCNSRIELCFVNQLRMYKPQKRMQNTLRRVGVSCSLFDRIIKLIKFYLLNYRCFIDACFYFHGLSFSIDILFIVIVCMWNLLSDSCTIFIL